MGSWIARIALSCVCALTALGVADAPVRAHQGLRRLSLGVMETIRGQGPLACCNVTTSCGPACTTGGATGYRGFWDQNPYKQCGPCMYPWCTNQDTSCMYTEYLEQACETELGAAGETKPWCSKQLP